MFLAHNKSQQLAYWPTCWRRK